MPNRCKLVARPCPRPGRSTRLVARTVPSLGPQSRSTAQRGEAGARQPRAAHRARVGALRSGRKGVEGASWGEIGVRRAGGLPAAPRNDRGPPVRGGGRSARALAAAPLEPRPRFGHAPSGRPMVGDQGFFRRRNARRSRRYPPPGGGGCDRRRRALPAPVGGGGVGLAGARRHAGRALAAPAAPLGRRGRTALGDRRLPPGPAARRVAGVGPGRGPPGRRPRAR